MRSLLDNMLWAISGVPTLLLISMVPVGVSHVAIGESSKELAKPNSWILAILAKWIELTIFFFLINSST